MIVNLLPHPVNVHGEKEVIIPPSGWALQLKITEGNVMFQIEGIPVFGKNKVCSAFLTRGKERKHLPPIEEGVWYIISRGQSQFFKRADCLVPKTAPYETPKKMKRKIRSVKGLRLS